MVQTPLQGYHFIRHFSSPLPIPAGKLLRPPKVMQVPGKCPKHHKHAQLPVLLDEIEKKSFTKNDHGPRRIPP